MSTMNFPKPTVGENVKAVFRGFRRMLCGTAVAATGGASGIIFTWISDASGYLAVLNFLAAVGLLAVTVYFLWLLGGGKKRPGAFMK